MDVTKDVDCECTVWARMISPEQMKAPLGHHKKCKHYEAKPHVKIGLPGSGCTLVVPLKEVGQTMQEYIADMAMNDDATYHFEIVGISEHEYNAIPEFAGY